MADLLARRALYSRTSQALTDLDDNQFAAAIGDRPPDARRGWGDSYRTEVCGFPVFVKRLPLTDEERGRPDDTRNIFGLPDFYHYGVGSAGFGAYREVAGHFKVGGEGGSEARAVPGTRTLRPHFGSLAPRQS